MSEIPTLPGFEPALTCGNGSPWGPHGCGPCAGCQAESARMAAQVEAEAMRRDDDVSTLTCPLTELERDFADELKRSAAVTSDADLVRAALYCLARQVDLPIAIQTFALRGGTAKSKHARTGRRWRKPVVYAKATAVGA